MITRYDPAPRRPPRNTGHYVGTTNLDSEFRTRALTLIEPTHPLPCGPPNRAGTNSPPPLPDWADPKSEVYDPLRVLREKPFSNRPSPPPPCPPPTRKIVSTESTGPR